MPDNSYGLTPETIKKMFTSGVRTYVLFDDALYSGDQMKNMKVKMIIAAHRRAGVPLPRIIVVAPFTTRQAEASLKELLPDIELITAQYMPAWEELLSNEEREALRRVGLAEAIKKSVNVFDHKPSLDGWSLPMQIMGHIDGENGASPHAPYLYNSRNAYSRMDRDEFNEYKEKGLVTYSGDLARAKGLADIDRAMTAQDMLDRARMLSDHLENISGKKLVEIAVPTLVDAPFESLLKGKVSAAVEQGQVMLIDLKQLRNYQYDRLAPFLAAINLLGSAIERELSRQNPAVLEAETVDAVQELLKNALYHGNRMNWDLPILMWIDKNTQRIMVYDVASPLAVDPVMEEEASKDRRIHTAGVGLLYTSLFWDFSSDPEFQELRSTAGELLGTVVSIQLKDFAMRADQKMAALMERASALYSSAKDEMDFSREMDRLAEENDWLHTGGFGDIVEKDGQGYVLTGDPMSGKTKLSFALTRLGFHYISSDGMEMLRSANGSRVAVGPRFYDVGSPMVYRSGKFLDKKKDEKDVIKKQLRIQPKFLPVNGAIFLVAKTGVGEGIDKFPSFNALRNSLLPNFSSADHLVTQFGLAYKPGLILQLSIPKTASARDFFVKAKAISQQVEGLPKGSDQAMGRGPGHRLTHPDLEEMARRMLKTGTGPLLVDEHNHSVMEIAWEVVDQTARNLHLPPQVVGAIKQEFRIKARELFVKHEKKLPFVAQAMLKDGLYTRLNFFEKFVAQSFVRLRVYPRVEYYAQWLKDLDQDELSILVHETAFVPFTIDMAVERFHEGGAVTKEELARFVGNVFFLLMRAMYTSGKFAADWERINADHQLVYQEGKRGAARPRGFINAAAQRSLMDDVTELFVYKITRLKDRGWPADPVVREKVQLLEHYMKILKASCQIKIKERTAPADPYARLRMRVKMFEALQRGTGRGTTDSAMRADIAPFQEFLSKGIVSRDQFLEAGLIPEDFLPQLTDPTRGWLTAITGTESRLERDVGMLEVDLHQLFPRDFEKVRDIFRQAQDEANPTEEIGKAAQFVEESLAGKKSLVLEIAAGKGQLSRRIAEVNRGKFNVIATDLFGSETIGFLTVGTKFWRSLIKRLKEGKEVEAENLAALRVDDAILDHIPDNSLDYILLMLPGEDLVDQFSGRGIEFFQRKLKPGGRIVVRLVRAREDLKAPVRSFFDHFMATDKMMLDVDLTENTEFRGPLHLYEYLKPKPAAFDHAMQAADRSGPTSAFRKEVQAIIEGRTKLLAKTGSTKGGQFWMEHFLEAAVLDFTGAGILKDQAEPQEVSRFLEQAEVIWSKIQAHPEMYAPFKEYLQEYVIQISDQDRHTPFFIAAANFLAGRPLQDRKILEEVPVLQGDTQFLRYHPWYGKDPVALLPNATTQLREGRNKKVRVLLVGVGERFGENQKTRYLQTILRRVLGPDASVEIVGTDIKFQSDIYSYDQVQDRFSHHNVFDFRERNEWVDPESGVIFRKVDLSDPKENIASDPSRYDSNEKFDVVINTRVAIQYGNDTSALANMLQNCKNHLAPSGLLLYDPPHMEEVEMYFNDPSRGVINAGFLPFRFEGQVQIDLDQMFTVLGFRSDLIEKAYRLALKHAEPGQKELQYKRMLFHALAQVVKDPDYLSAILLMGIEPRYAGSGVFDGAAEEAISGYEEGSLRTAQFVPARILDVLWKPDRQTALNINGKPTDRKDHLEPGQIFHVQEPLFDDGKRSVTLGRIDLHNVLKVEDSTTRQVTYLFDSAMADSAITEDAVPGGIDLTAKNLGLEIRRDANGNLLPLTPEQLGKLKIDGLSPVIINITPVEDLPWILGLKSDQPGDTARVGGPSVRVPDMSFRPLDVRRWDYGDV